ncbi:transcription antitermination factor NusB [Salisediminibacterium beveridgei]|uniref:Transcription antitermination protein NusB n=1 Tax=Salisediminibacterium beveridgei TaxID=632773 RepID=A0A1D7QUL5_9BACI|nr:transcription antitermination factor NusB [Salisediminibacterium beveridgei]AOM82669.1 Transcription termination protein NusB [Salisediminibacterium beveridgei]
MKRRVARIKAVQALYQVEMTDEPIDSAINNVLQDNEVTDPYLESVVQGVVDHLDELDDVLQASMDNWAIDRLARVDRAILRIALYEIMYSDDVPVNVGINEAIEIARGFSSDEEAGKFVNGVLSNAAKRLEEDA